METALFLVPWLVLGIAVAFVAFSGGPGRARAAYLTGGGRAVRVIAVVAFVGFGIAVPAGVIATSGPALGAEGRLAATTPDPQLTRGKRLFRQTCASCHALAAANSRGVTGPNLDQLGALDAPRVLSAIERGGTGQYRMPAGLLAGEDAEAVAAYVAAVAGR